MVRGEFSLAISCATGMPGVGEASGTQVLQCVASIERARVQEPQAYGHKVRKEGRKGRGGDLRVVWL